MSTSAAPPAPEHPPALAPAWSRRKVAWLCTALGAWGVATGLAVFVLLWTHGRPHPLTFVAGLLVAALIAYIAELLRDLIKEGVAIPALTGPRVIVTVLLLMIIELVVHAGTALVQLSGHGPEATTAKSELQAVAVLAAGGDRGLVTELIVLALAWMAVGALVARRLSRLVFERDAPLRVAMARGAIAGALGGVITAPAAALGCLLALRWIGTVREMIVNGEAWARDLKYSLTHTALDSAGVALLKLPGWLWLGAWNLTRWGHGLGAALLATLLAGGAAWAWRRRSPKLGRILLAALALLVLAPLTGELDRLGRTALLAVLIWVVPGTLLGLAAPLLRGAGDEPRTWGLIAFAAAALLALLTLLKFAHPWCYALAAGLVFVGLLFFRGAPLRDYWPLAAAAMASMVSGVMVLVERATFLGVFAEVHAVHNLPAVRPDPLLANLGALMDLTRPDAALDDDEMRALGGKVRQLARLPADRQAAQLEEISRLLAQLQARMRREEAARLRAIPGGTLWSPLVAPSDFAPFYGELAALVENPPARAARDGAFGALAARIDALIAPEQSTEDRLAAARAREDRLKAELEAAVQSGTASEDTVRHGAEIGALAADLHAFAQLPVSARGDRGAALKARLEKLLEAEGLAANPEPQVPGRLLATRGTSFESQQTRRIIRLVDLWQRLARELAAPGAGGFAAPQVFTGDPATLPWRRNQPLTLPGGRPLPKAKTRLESLQDLRAEIERQRAALATEQEPASRPAPTAPAHEPAKSAPAIALENRFALSIMFPTAVKLARLAEIREQLLVVQAAAQGRRDAWSAPSAVMLELSLVGSFGFWVTVALLAAWSLTEPRKAEHH